MEESEILILGFSFLKLIFWLIVSIIFIIVDYIVARKFEKIARQKGYNSEIHSFAMCFWLGITGYLYVIALPNLNNYVQVTNKSINSQNKSDDYLVLKCPVCKELVAKGTVMCPRCQHVFNWNDHK